MSVSYFISKRILKSEVQGKKVSKAIVRISVVSISLAIVVNLITIAIVKGFQHQVREKITGFGSHLFVMGASDGSLFEAHPIRKDQVFLKQLSKNQAIRGIHPVGYKPVLFQSKRFISKSAHGESEKQNIQGAVIKGVDQHYDWAFFQQYLVAGRTPRYSDTITSNELLISQATATQLHYSLGDTIRGFFVRNKPVLKLFHIVGIYDTGLEEQDKKLAIGDLRMVQELNDWGISAQITIEDTMYQAPAGYENELIVGINPTGGTGRFRFDWGKGYEKYGRKTYNGFKDTTYTVAVSDFMSHIDGRNETTTLPDTTSISIQVTGNKKASNQFETDESGILRKNYLDDSGLNYMIKAGDKTFHVQETPGKGSFNNYVGGFEINLHQWEMLPEVAEDLKKQIEFIPTQYGETLKITSIMDNENDIFIWLSFLDINVAIILVLMVLIGIINMGSALLVLILIRTNFIGILKALGASDWTIRKIFLTQASFLILRGMFWGNLVGIGFCLLQAQFNLVTLNPEVYYLNTVPIELNAMDWALLNLGTLVVCVTALIVPSIVITRISPTKAIRFN